MDAVVTLILCDDCRLCDLESKKQAPKAVLVNITSGLGSPLPFAASHIVLVLMSAHQRHVPKHRHCMYLLDWKVTGSCTHLGKCARQLHGRTTSAPFSIHAVALLPHIGRHDDWQDVATTQNLWHLYSKVMKQWSQHDGTAGSLFRQYRGLLGFLGGYIKSAGRSKLQHRCIAGFLIRSFSELGKCQCMSCFAWPDPRSLRSPWQQLSGLLAMLSLATLVS